MKVDSLGRFGAMAVGAISLVTSAYAQTATLIYI